MRLKDINFGDVDAKNEILKQLRNDDKTFFESFSLPKKVNIDDFKSGQLYFILGLKGTGKTALLRYMSEYCKNKGGVTEIILFKTQVSEEDRQSLSNNSGFEIIATDNVPHFLQDFKEAWKWMIYQRIAVLLRESGVISHDANRLYKLCGLEEGFIQKSIGALFSSIKSGNLKLSTEALGVALEVGLSSDKSESSKFLISDLNRAFESLLDRVKIERPLYLFFDELELFHQNAQQFDRDRRIIRDLVYAISQINAASAERGRRVFLCSTLRTEVLHSVLELGHEIGRDIDDFGIRLDWSDGKDAIDHPLMELIKKKIAASASMEEDRVWDALFPEKINNQIFYKFILNSSYYRPRDIVRLLRVAREFRSDDVCFTSEHFDQTSKEYSKQTWLEVTEELLAAYSSEEIGALQRLFLGFKTHFFSKDITERANTRYARDPGVQDLLKRHDLSKILSDLYRIGVVGNDFVVKEGRGPTRRRNRWIFRGNASLNDWERMAIHKSLWKHLSLVDGRR